ncbi:hypothetical protein A4H97_14100 [Niastella yeongjuensis]|uniref:Metallo-beta-lactamase domain-containing protein n=1 Tax=Niastella yeongjuensis TaxID=354355 RepID=A0A1V9E3R4_9BACT|nr:hypothetical protein [Niastella yeongjuensis]OQP40748.1 hypothetical protein A4H97_14100 [Niastella yeongjuensis]SEP02857.1 hypothetical protein SAMN05660816_04236 [Niastella yeongjuensis]
MLPLQKSINACPSAKRLWLLLAVFLIIFKPLSAQDERLEIHHINIENGDATLIVVHDIKANTFNALALIDGGNIGTDVFIKPYFSNLFGAKKLPVKVKYMILSHFHADHYRGLLGIKTGTVFRAENITDPGGYDLPAKYARINPPVPDNKAERGFNTGAKNNYVGALKKAFDKKYITQRSKDITTFPGDIKKSIEIGTVNGIPVNLICVVGGGYSLGKDGNIVNNTTGKGSRLNANNYTLGFVLTYGQFRYFTGGDMGGQDTSPCGSYLNQETSLDSGLSFLFSDESYPFDNKVTDNSGSMGHICAFKVSHHGSNCSSNDEFLQTTSAAVFISAGNIDHWVQSSDVDFTLISAIGLSLKKYGFILIINNNPATGDISTSFTVTGTFQLGKTSLNVSVTVPVSYNTPNNQWTLLISTTQTLAGELNDILGLFPGINVLGSLPQDIVILNQFSISQLQLVFDPAELKVYSTTVQVSNPHPWKVVEALTIESLVINFALDFTQEKTDFTLDIDGSFTMKKDPVEAYFTVNVHLPFGGTEWLFAFSAELEIDDYSPFFNAMPGLDNTPAPPLPVSIQLKKFDVNSFEIAYNPVSRQLSRIGFDISTEAKIGLFNLLEIVDPYLALTIYNPFNSENRRITGDMGTQLNIGDIPLEISAVKEDPEDGWTFTGSMKPGSVINIIELVHTFLKPLGITSLPAWLDANKLNLKDVSVSIYTPAPEAIEQNNTYAVTGTVEWALNYQSFQLQSMATLDMTYDSSRKTNAAAGTLTVTAQLLGMYFKVGYKFGTPDTELYLQWEEIVCDYKHDSVSNKDVITVTFGTMSLGGIITKLIKAIDPGFSLPAPWNALNSISLDGLSLKYTRFLDDESKNSMVIIYQHSIDLGFLQINSILLTKDSSGVYLGFTGSFLGIAIKEDDPTTGPLAGKGSDVQNLPQVPGMGDSLFNLHFLGMGQHVAFSSPKQIKTIKEAIDELGKSFSDTNSKPNSLPLKKGGALQFDQQSGWLIGADFTVAKFYRFATVFNDPNLYGLMISIDKAAGNFANLDFEILYKKVTDTIGVYQIDLQLPDIFRHLEFGQVSITLPNIGIKIFTNGDFFLDFGFPASITDFSRSFTIQVFPFTGSGGFYFGWLSGATSTSIPATTNGIFNPVIEFGVGLNLGVGKSIEAGILKAGLSLTAVGIFHGAVAFFRPNPHLKDVHGNPLSDDLYYKLQGTFGLVGHIYGEINFAIISARLDIMAYVYVSITIEAYMPIPIKFQAGVSVSLRVTINLGLFKIKISLSFSATISAEFIIGQNTTARASWNLPVQPALPLPYALKSATPELLKWQPVIVDTGIRYLLDIYFTPHLTLSGEGSQPGPRYVSMFYLNTADSGEPKQVNGLTALATGVLYWTLNALKGATQTSTSLSWLNEQQVAADDLALLLCYFNTRKDNISPFNYRNKSGHDLVAFLQSFFTVQIAAVNAGTDQTLQASVFPVLPELLLQTLYNGVYSPVTDFSTQSPTGTQNYIAAITSLLKWLSVDYESGLTSAYFSPDLCSMVTDPDYENQPDLSLPTFIFTDFIAIIAKQLLQNAYDYLAAQSDQTVTVLTLVNNTITPANVQQLGGMSSRFLLHGLRLPAPPDAATGVIQPLYQLTGQQLVLPPALKLKDQYSLLLSKPAADAWIVFAGGVGNTTLTITIDDNEIQRIIDVGRTLLSPSLQAGSPAPIVNYNDIPQAFTIGSPAVWQYPGALFPPETVNPVIWKLPANLQQVLAGHAGETLEFDLLTITPGNNGPADKGSLSHFDWCTIIDIDIQQITAGQQIKTPLAGNMYNLIGADDAGVTLLQQMLTYMDSAGDVFIKQIQLLYQPDKTTNTAGGYISAASNALQMGIVKANLSKETNPAAGQERMAQVRTRNTLNSNGEFIRLLWEDSIVRSGGFYLYYQTLADGKGLPDYLFNENGTARCTLVITYHQLITQSFVNGVVTGDPLDLSRTTVYAQSDSITTRVATLQPGTVGYTMVRNFPGFYNPVKLPPTAQENEIYLQNQFNLVGVLLPGISSYANLLPSGPSDSLDEDQVAQVKAGISLFKADDDPWNYSAIIPYYKYVQTSRQSAGFPDPYAGTGTTVQMQLNWQDMFGNIPTKGTPLLNVAMPLLYTDPLIALSQWPSMSTGYLFDIVDNSPAIIIGFSFDTSRYTGGNEEAKRKAAIDLQTYMQLYYQLNRQQDMAMSFTTSIDGTSVNHEGSSRKINIETLIKELLLPIIQFLESVIAGNTPVSTGIPAPWQIISAIDANNIASYNDIFQLTATVTIERTSQVDPAFANRAGVAFAHTTLQPLSGSQTGSTSEANGLSLSFFATRFEAAFADRPVTGIVLKLSTATSAGNNKQEDKTRPALWVVRFDASGAKGIRFTFRNQQVYFFAPVPLANSLLSFDAAVAPYKSGQPYPAGNPLTHHFNSIDLDGWGLQFLQSADKFLSPAYAVPAFLLDNGVSLNKVLDEKQKVADAIEGTVDFIIEPDGNGAGAAMANARTKWKNQLLVQLANAYHYAASVQTPVTIDSLFTGPNSDPPMPPYVPALYGSMVGSDPSVPGAQNLPGSTEYTLSTVKVPLGAGDSWLTYMFVAKDASRERSFHFNNMQFVVSHIEKDIHAVPGIKDYLASTWLTFVIPLNETLGNVGPVTIPVPLRAYPGAPSLVNQDTIYPVNDNNVPPLNVQAMRTWDYRYTYRNSTAAQDTITTRVQFNIPADKTGRIHNSDDSEPTLYEALAQFIQVYPVLGADLDTYLLALTAEDVANQTPVAIKANYAVQTFITLFKAVAKAWGNWNQIPIRTGKEIKDNILPVIPTLEYSIEESGEPGTGDLIITTTPVKGQTSLLVPTVNIAGFTPEPVDGSHRNKYKNDVDNNYLLYADRNNDPNRILTYEALDILVQQNGWGGVSIVRNQELIQNADNTWQLTNPFFIYQTPEVRFYNKQIPLLHCNRAMDIAEINPVTGMQKRTLEENIRALFAALTQSAYDGDVPIKLNVEYQFIISNTTFDIHLPVLLVSSGKLNTKKQGVEFADMVSEALTKWLTKHNPATDQAQFNFTVTIYSEVDPGTTVFEADFYLVL